MCFARTVRTEPSPPSIFFLMPAKQREKMEKARRLKILEENIDHMLLEGHITKEAYENMIEILLEKMDKPKTGLVPPPPEQLDVAV